jgi:hypothetical protein
MVITQEPAQSLAALNRPPTIELHPVPREQQDVTVALMVAVPTKNLIPMAKVKNRGMIRPNDRDLDTAPIHARLAL